MTSPEVAAALRDQRRRWLRVLALVLFAAGLVLPFASFTRDGGAAGTTGLVAGLERLFDTGGYPGEVYLFGRTTGSGLACLGTEPVMFLPAGMLLLGLIAGFLPRVRRDSLGRALLLACGGAPALLLLFLLIRGQVSGWHVLTYRTGYWSWLASTLLLVALTATEPRPDPNHYEA